MEHAIIVLVVALGGVALWTVWRILRNLGDLGFIKGRKPRHLRDLVKVDGPNTAKARRAGTSWAITVTGPDITRKLRIYRLPDCIGLPPLDIDNTTMIVEPGIAAEGEDQWLIADGTPLRVAFRSNWRLDGAILETWAQEPSQVEERLEEGLRLAALLSQRRT